jgi:tetratricopeptide (TPR) repeat protein
MVERALWNGENESARALLAEAIPAARASGGVSHLGNVLNNLLNLAADLARREGEYDRARALLEESLEIPRTVGNTHGIFNALRDLASLALARGDDTGARSLFEQAAAVAQQAAGHYDWALTMVGEIARQTGELERAAAIYEQALAQFRDQGKPRGTAVVLHSLGHTELRQGLVPSARARFVESLLLSEAVGDGVNAALCVAGLGAVEGAAGRPERGARLLGAAAARLRDRATRLDEVDRAELERAEAAAVAALGRDAFDAAFTEGQAMTWEQALALAHDA